MCCALKWCCIKISVPITVRMSVTFMQSYFISIKLINMVFWLIPILMYMIYVPFCKSVGDVTFWLSWCHHFWPWLRKTSENKQWFGLYCMCTYFNGILIHCKRGNFRVGVNFCVFHAFVFFAKITPTQKIKPICLFQFLKEIGVVSWKLSPREMSCQCFREIFPQRK